MPPVEVSVERALDAVAAAPSVVAGLRAATTLTQVAAATTDASRTLSELVAAIDDGDQLTSIAAVHAASARPGDPPAAVLVDLVDDGRWHIAEHAAWALSGRRPQHRAMRPLVDLIVRP